MIFHIECLPDEKLIRTLGVTRKQLKHHNDKGRVCDYLQANIDKIGMIDEDPGSAQPKYLRALQEGNREHNIRLIEDTQKSNRIIILCPKLEDWIINVCEEGDINISDFGLSSTSNALHKEINSKLPQFEKLLNHLLEERNAALLYLKKLLKSR